MGCGKVQSVATVLSTRVLDHDQKSIFVESGGFEPVRWFLTHAIHHNYESDTESIRPAAKRRKLHDPTPPIDISDTSQYIPVSQCVLDLHFPSSLTATPLDEGEITGDVEISESTAITVQVTVHDQDASTKLTLTLPGSKSSVLEVHVTSLHNSILKAFRQCGALWHKKGGTHRVAERSPTLPVYKLVRSSGKSYVVVRLVASLYWKSGHSAYPTGYPTGRRHQYHCYDEVLVPAFPDESCHVRQPLTWSPQYFYDCIYTPPESETCKAFDNVIEAQLYPFQERTVSWMLRREGVQFINGTICATSNENREDDVDLYSQFNDFEGRVCYVNHVQGIVVRAKPPKPSRLVSGGLLLEEMGLGKSVEVLTLVASHQRNDITERFHGVRNPTRLRLSKATLIITPSSILEQWQTEIARHAPGLRVCAYEGVPPGAAKVKSTMVEDLATKYDIILITYQTLTREVHFAEDPPDRNMRQPRKFERKRSPLVEIQWWRICMDEAQMIESGVSASARVARRLPRVHSWAVTGTPLRKDIQDLHGLLAFLNISPFCNSPRLWGHFINNHLQMLPAIFKKIAIRHTKAQTREDIALPVQKRVVITMPFSAVEHQHYSSLFTSMCDEVGVTLDGAPTTDDWDPENSETIESMRSWLQRLRQTCLHPQIGRRNRRALGRGQGPLRTAAEVLELMIDQAETVIRTEEQNLLSSHLMEAHILGNAKEDEHRAEKALAIYTAAMTTCIDLVHEARKRLAKAKEEEGRAGTTTETDEEDSSTESTLVLGKHRLNLRSVLQLQHVCTFFAATAYYQIKSNIVLTVPESENFKELEDKETNFYEKAKVLRKELLSGISRRSDVWMRKIADMSQKDRLTKMPEVKYLESLGGIESRNIVEKSDIVFDVLREQAKVAMEWRAKMAEYLLKPLVDVDDGNEITGDEYEDSTKLQDELYVYFDAIKALQADMNTFVTGQGAPLIDHEVKTKVKECRKVLDPEVPEELKQQLHAPSLALELYSIRNKFRNRKDEVGSIRGLIQEARLLETSLQGFDVGARAAERHIARRHLTMLQSIFTAYTKALNGLEKEVDLFRSTQNQRLEFYRQLQVLSDAVQPYKEEFDEVLDIEALNNVLQKVERQSKILAQSKTKQRFLLHLRDESNAQEGQRLCVICQCQFETGVLTVCGHQYCKECIGHWWTTHRNCPVCKRKLALVDFHDITYKPQELKALEETNNSPSMSSRDNRGSAKDSDSIYSQVDSTVLSEIKSIDLPTSYGTKIDTLGRHLHWLREHDPGAKSIVFSQYREFLDVLSVALRDFKIGFTRLGKPNAVETFKNDPSYECLLLDAKTNSSGLTLVNATHVFLCEPLVQTAVELQAIARVHRIGQTRPTTVWMYLLSDSVEEAIYDLSVTRRLQHVQSQQTRRTVASDGSSANDEILQENALDAANTEEMQAVAISKLLTAGKNGGELVAKRDLWQCLFGKVHKSEGSTSSAAVEIEVARHLRAEAAEKRHLAA